MSRTPNKGTETVLATKLAAGTQMHLSTVTKLTVGCATFTPSEAEAQLTALATLYSNVDAARVAMQAKLLDQRMKGPAMRAFLMAFVSFVRATFGESPDVLADFGLAPKKVKSPLTAEQQLAAKAKSLATRKARGTTSKKQKLAIKGAVTGVIVTPVTAAHVTSSANGAPPVNGSAS